LFWSFMTVTSRIFDFYLGKSKSWRVTTTYLYQHKISILLSKLTGDVIFVVVRKATS